MKLHWFERFGWWYRPVSLMGVLVSAAAIALCVWVFLAVDRNSHSVSDTLIGVFPYVISFFVVWGWVASNTTE